MSSYPCVGLDVHQKTRRSCPMPQIDAGSRMTDDPRKRANATPKMSTAYLEGKSPYCLFTIAYHGSPKMVKT